MVNYNNGKIYKIEDLAGEMCYIGSTTKERLCQRMVEHRSKYLSWKAGKCGKVTSFDIFDKYGIENCRIVLVETYPCESKDELTSRESYFIKTVACVNKYVPHRTRKQYYHDNKEDTLATNKQYKMANIEKVKEQQALGHICLCGSRYTNSNRSHHIKTKLHLDYIANNPENINI